MALLVVSDLHIQGAEDPIYRSLLSLLRDRARPGDTVVLAGDLFDLFVGSKRIFIDRYAEFFRESARAGARGVKVHYIEGNHDFLLRGAFREARGVEVHGRELLLELGDKRFFVAHGDLANSRDYGYRFLRGLFRSPLFRGLLWLLPGAAVDWIGRTSSRYSRRHKPELPACLPRGKMEGLRRIYRSYAAERIAHGFDYVVMGHCHDLDEMSFVVGGRPGQYINAGFPRVHGSFLSWQPGDERIGREKLPGG